MAAEQWAVTAERVKRSLRRRGVDDHTAEDLVQEVALRMLAKGVQFHDHVHRERWAVRVAWNLAQNRWRDDRRLAYIEPPETTDVADVAHTVEQRESLGRVLAGFRDLAERDRQAIILGFEPAGQDGATTVRRHRARAKLARLRGAIGLGLARLRARGQSLVEALAEDGRHAVYACALLAAPFGASFVDSSAPVTSPAAPEPIAVQGARSASDAPDGVAVAGVAASASNAGAAPTAGTDDDGGTAYEVTAGVNAPGGQRAGVAIEEADEQDHRGLCAGTALCIGHPVPPGILTP